MTDEESNPIPDENVVGFVSVSAAGFVGRGTATDERVYEDDEKAE